MTRRADVGARALRESRRSWRGSGRRFLHVALLALCAAGSRTAVAQATSPDERAIRDARERSNRAIAAHDTAAMAAEWMASLIVVTSNGEQQVGRAANVASFARLFATRPDVVYRRTPSTITLYTPWTMAGESGRWEGSWTANGARIRVGGSYFAKWIREGDGRWRIQAEIYMPEHCDGAPYCTTRPDIR